MEVLIKNFHLLIVFQVATANMQQIDFLNLEPLLRNPRNVKVSNNPPGGFDILGKNPFLTSFTLPMDQYNQVSLFPKTIPQYRSANDQLQQFPVLSNDVLYRSSYDIQNQPEAHPETMEKFKFSNNIKEEQLDDGLPVVVNGYLRQPTDETENDESHKTVDNRIKNHLITLQTFQNDFNKLIEDIKEAALSFLSTHSFFGGLTRRSLLDPTNLDYLRIWHIDVSKISGDFYEIGLNLADDLKGVLNYMSDHRNYNLKQLFSQGVTTMLRVFTFQ